MPPVRTPPPPPMTPTTRPRGLTVVAENEGADAWRRGTVHNLRDWGYPIGAPGPGCLLPQGRRGCGKPWIGRRAGAAGVVCPQGPAAR